MDAEKKQQPDSQQTKPQIEEARIDDLITTNRLNPLYGSNGLVLPNASGAHQELANKGENIAGESILTVDGHGGTRILAATGDKTHDGSTEMQRAPGIDMPASGTLKFHDIQRMEEMAELERMGQNMGYMDQKYDSRSNPQIAQQMPAPSFGVQNAEGAGVYPGLYGSSHPPRRDIFSFAPLNQQSVNSIYPLSNQVNTIPLGDHSYAQPSGHLIKGPTTHLGHRLSSYENKQDGGIRGGGSPFRLSNQKQGLKKQGQVSEPNGNYHQLVKAKKLAVSTKRHVDITEKLHSNHIKVSDSQQTYNPYHLSSYNAQNQAEKPGSNSYHYRGIAIRDGLMADGMIMHDPEITSGEVSTKGVNKVPVEQQINSASGGPINLSVMAIHAKSAMNFSTEIRKQSKKKQEMVQRFQGQKRSNTKDRSLIRRANQHFPSQIDKSSNEKGPKNGIFGVQGERAQMSQANYALQIGRNQMNEIAQMQEELEENLRKLQYQKECQAHRSKNVYYGQNMQIDKRQPVYRIDSVFQNENNMQQRGYQTGNFVTRLGLKRVPRTQAGKSMGSYDDAQLGVMNYGRTSSHASSHQRRIEAQKALQTFVIKENLSPQVHVHPEGPTTNTAVSGEPGSPVNPLKVPTVTNPSGAIANPTASQLNPASTTFNFESNQIQSSPNQNTGSFDQKDQDLSLSKEQRMRQMGLEQSNAKFQKKAEQPTDEYQLRTVDKTKAGFQQKKQDSLKSKAQNESQMNSTSSMHVAGLQRQSGYSRKRSSGQGSCQLQAIGNLNEKSWPKDSVQGQRDQPDVGSGSHDQSANAQRQAIYSSYNLQRINKQDANVNQMMHQSDIVSGQNDLRLEKSQKSAPYASKQQQSRLVSIKSDMKMQQELVKSESKSQDGKGVRSSKEASRSGKKQQQKSQIDAARDSLVSNERETRIKNKLEMIQVDATADIEIFDNSKKLDKTMSPDHKIVSSCGSQDAAGDQNINQFHTELKEQLEEKNEPDNKPRPREEASEQKLTTPLQSNIVPVLPESEATLRQISMEKSPDNVNVMELNGTKLLAEAMQQQAIQQSDQMKINTDLPVSDKREAAPGGSGNLAATENTLPQTDNRAKSHQKIISSQVSQNDNQQSGNPEAKEIDHLQSETTEIMVLSAGNGAGLLQSDFMVKGAKLGTQSNLNNHFYYDNNGISETPLTREPGKTNAASTALFNQRKVNNQLLLSGTGLKPFNANIRSQEQLRARRVQRKHADYGSRVSQVKSGLSSQIHIHDHILQNKSQERGTTFVNSYLRGQRSFVQNGLSYNTQNMRKQLASQGRSGGYLQPGQKWPMVLIAVKTDDRNFKREQQHSFKNQDFGAESNQLFGLQSEKHRNIRSLKEGLFSNDFQVKDQNEPQRDLRKLLDVKDRKKVQFRPAPSRVGLKFKNKSEEERYMKVVTKILQMDHMSQPQIEVTLLSIQKFLNDYVKQILQVRNGSPKQKGSDFNFYDDFLVQPWMVTKFIKVIKGLNNQEAQTASEGEINAANFAGGVSRLSADVPSTKHSAQNIEIKQKFGHKTRMGFQGKTKLHQELAEQVENEQNSRPITQGQQRLNQNSVLKPTDRSQQEMAEPEQRTNYLGTKPVTILSFIKNILGLRKRGNTNRYKAALTANNLSPSPSKRTHCQVDGGSQQLEQPESGEEADNHGFQNEYNFSSGAEDFMEPGTFDDEQRSSESDRTWAKWEHQKIFPAEKWTDPKTVDPSSLYDGRRRDGYKPLLIPTQLLQRNYQLNKYIDDNTKYDQYETLLQSVLATAYFSMKQQNSTDKTMLNRLQSKNVMKSMMQREASINLQGASMIENQSQFGGGVSAQVSKQYTQVPRVFEKQAEMVEESRDLPAVSQASGQVSRSNAVTIATHVHQSGAAKGNFSRDYSGALLHDQAPQADFVMHDPSDQPIQTVKQTLDANDGISRNPSFPRVSLNQNAGLPPKSSNSLPAKRPKNQSMGHRARHPPIQGSGIVQLLKGGEDQTTQALKNQSVIRRNGLMLEHIMRQRGQQDAENQVLAELYTELRNIEKREGIYSYKGNTRIAGQTGEGKSQDQSKYLLVKIHRQSADAVSNQFNSMM